MAEYFLVAARGRLPLELGPRLRSGGEAEIRPVPGWQGCVAKIYHPAKTASHASRDKLEAMLHRPPEHMTCRACDVDLPQFAWPTHIVEDARGGFRGFMMREVPADRSELLSTYMAREQMGAKLSRDDCSLPRRVLICANLASAITELHRLRHYFVDIKPANISMFKDTGILCLLDNDSFSIEGAAARFPATAFTSEYLAPELMLNELSASAVVTDSQDRFALAVLVFQILNNGLHPFQSVPLFETEEWNIDLCVKDRLYAYGLTEHPEVRPAPASVHDTWPMALRQMFDRAFLEQQPSRRPAAKEWRDLMQSFFGKFARCAERPQDVLHIHFDGMPCQECRFEQVAAQRSAKRATQRAADAVGSQAVRSTPSGAPVKDPSPNSRPDADAAPVGTGAGGTGLPPTGSGRDAAAAAAASARSVAAPPAKRSKLAYAAVAALIVAAIMFLNRSPDDARTPPPPVVSPKPAVTETPAAPPPPAPAATPALPAAQSPRPSQAPAAPAARGNARPVAPIDDATLALARSVQDGSDGAGVNARQQVILRTLRAAYEQNRDDMMALIAAGLAGDDAATLSGARTLMRNTEFISAFSEWKYTRLLGRDINKRVLEVYRGDLQLAVAEQFKALALAPVDREVAANLAYYMALQGRQDVAIVAAYALSLPRPGEATGTASAWQTLAVALARAGKTRESEAAFHVARAITSKLPMFCKNLLTHERDFGPELRGPITAVFKRIQERGQSSQENCAYPPQWLQ